METEKCVLAIYSIYIYFSELFVDTGERRAEHPGEDAEWKQRRDLSPAHPSPHTLGKVGPLSTVPV